MYVLYTADVPTHNKAKVVTFTEDSNKPSRRAKQSRDMDESRTGEIRFDEGYMSTDHSKWSSATTESSR